MTQGQTIQVARFNSLAAVMGEQLTHGSASVRAVVNRQPKRERFDRIAARDGKLDFTLKGASEVEILFTSLAEAPVAGETFYDAVGMRHRIRFVEQTDVSWLCMCSSTKK